MQINWGTALPVAAAVIALGSMLFSFRSSQIARNSLKLSLRTAQSAYEASKVEPRPAVGMTIDEIQYRLGDAPPADEKPREGLNIFELMESRYKLEKLNDVSGETVLEVVVHGSLANNTAHDLLLTLKPHGNHWLGKQGECAIDFKRTKGRLLESGSSDSFEFTIRRTAVSWAEINTRLTRKRFMYRFDLGGVPRLIRWFEFGLLGIEYFFGYRHFVERCEFMFVCEPRFTERVATVWRAQIRQGPVLSTRIDSGELKCSVLVGNLCGPFDDSVVLYRGEFDSTLAQIKPQRFAPSPPGTER